MFTNVDKKRANALLALVVMLFSIESYTSEITLDDRAEILEIIASYGHHFDRRDGAGFANLFSPQGSWHAFPNKSDKAVIVLNGRENIEPFADDRQNMFKRAGVETKHFMLDVVLDVQSATKVEASAMALILWQRPDRGDPLPRPVQTGYYNYTLHKSDEGWKFHRVEVHTSGVYKPEDIYGPDKSTPMISD